MRGYRWTSRIWPSSGDSSKPLPAPARRRNGLGLKRLMKALAPGDLIIMPAADRLARDPIDLVVLAREMQQAGAALRSLAEPYIDTAGDFA
jgi:DNA invertase Pin-like site-specific DNA recombinase